MRLTFTCLLLLGVLRTGWAQMHKSLLFNGKGLPGSYVLNADPHTRQTGYLKVYAHELVVHTDQGKTLRYKPQEVYRAQIGRVRYTTAQGFKTKRGLWATRQSSRLFVEVLDSGKVSLLRYTYYVGGHDNTATTALATYLLHEASADSVVTLPVNASGKGRHFQQVLMPYFVSRPDLLQLVEYEAITIDTLPALLHAYNTDAPFPYTTLGLPPARPRDEAQPVPTGN